MNDLELETMETQRLILRGFSAEAYEHVLSHAPDDEAMHTLGLTADALKKERPKAAKGFSTFNKAFLIFTIATKENERVIGWCGYHTWYVDHARAEIGYALYDDGFKRKGFMSEALASILEYGFREMKLKRVEALIGPDNVASFKTLRKFGFVEEGRLREHYFTNGRYEDSIIFSLLDREYPNP
jgi:ribosomal-protein-alanine N-acetyltransferase